MKKITLAFVISFLFFACSIKAQAPAYEWANQFGSSDGDYGYSVFVHSNGNVYSTGFFTGTVDFDPSSSGTSNLTADSTDIYILKMDASGGFVWAKKMGGPTSKDIAYSIVTDGNENVYLTGAFKGTAEFNPDGASTTLTSTGDYYDCFIAKLNASGTFQWVKQLEGERDVIGHSLAVDSNGDVYTTGWFIGETNFNPSGSAANLTPAGTNPTFLQYPWDGFIAKHSTDGVYQWSKQFGGTSYEFGSGIVLDGSNNSYVTGLYNSTADFNPSGTANKLTSAGGADIFVAKYDASGNNVWAKSMGSAGDDWGTAIALDGSGNILTTGVFQATSNFNPSGTAEITAAGANDVYDVFVSKLDGSGNYVWAKSMGSSGNDYGLSITADASNNVYTTGGFSNTANFNPSGTADNYTALGAADKLDNFITKHSSDGTYEWTLQFGGTDDDGSESVKVDASDNVYATGGFNLTADFDPSSSGTENLTSSGSTDAFVLKLSPAPVCALSIPSVTVVDTCGSTTLTSSSTSGTYLWSPGGETTQAITVYSVGTHSVTITEGACSSTSLEATAAPTTLPTTPTVSVVDTCDSSTLTSSTSTGTYLWSPSGETTQAILVSSSGTHTVNITENGCESLEGSGTATPTTTPSTPTVTVVNTCGNSTLTSSTTTGSYLWSPGGETTQAISVSSSGTYSVTITENGCASTAGTGISNPTTIPDAPTVSDISYCQSSTASALTATGTSLLWYTDGSGGPAGSTSAPTPSTSTIGQTDYFVSQTIGGCESIRDTITVEVTAGTAAPTTTNIEYCENEVASPLTASGTSLLWYVDTTGSAGSSTAPTPSTTSTGTVSYFVSQTQCGEGPKAQLDVIVNAIPTPPTVAVVDNCGNSDLTASNFTGTLLWSTAEISTSINVTSAATYSVTQTENGCESASGTGTAAPTAGPSAPGVTSPIDYCENQTASALTATGTNLIWYTAATGGLGTTSAPTPSTSGAGSMDYFVADSVGCVSATRSQITVNVTAAPAAPTVSTPVDYCQNDVATALTATGTSLLWYTATTGGPAGSATAITPSTTSTGSINYYVSQTVSTCESDREVIEVVVSAGSTAPTVTSPVTYCDNETASALTATGTSLLWYTSATGGVGSSSAPIPSTSVGASYFVSQTTCGEGARAEIVITIEPAPTVTVNDGINLICQSTNSHVTLTASGATTYTWLPVTGLNVSTSSSVLASPTSTTTYTVTGTMGNCSSTAVATVTVDVCDGIEDAYAGTNISVFPNPTTGEVTISISNANFTEAEISVINILGKVVFNNSYDNNAADFNKQINLSDVSNGIYYVKINIDGAIKIEKLIVQ